MKASVQRDPEIRLYFPIWCHLHGSKMRVKKLNLLQHILVIGSSAAKIVIRKALWVHSGAKGWFVDWEVNQYKPYKEGVWGRVHFTDKELAAAFGLSDDSGKFGDWLIRRFGADSAEQGKYIRWKTFLNIPCPGTGNDGDPNVSIHLDKEIQNAVRQLLK